MSSDSDDHQIPDPAVSSTVLQDIEKAEQEQLIREALAGLSPRCRELMQMLFFEEPSLSYNAIAAGIGIAVGSIGITRQRCIEKMRKRFEEVGML